MKLTKFRQRRWPQVNFPVFVHFGLTRFEHCAECRRTMNRSCV